ncbi:efflux RND transporter periplasmic adaptor subunit [Acidovorax cavernicola]|uniref:Efflux RND transporter periplasmic adaptor subunit n=1 Tax=Acidovorax cavernicola TaxID=1675792 RepID=A0A9X8GW87_9BURK|nr:efflux RND transporter periplasmic adaptor subunit [Acidovorax cavernicola]RIX83178.1 efflux RND transporter periplasmic adaptor subunit [Acidovorax cavernicola]
MSAGLHPLRRGRVLLLAVATLLILGVLLYQTFKPDPKPELVLSKVARGDIEQTVEATGTLKPSRLVSVGSQVSGRIESLHVKLGDKVKAGDLIAEIDSRTQLNTLRSAQAALRSARANRNALAASLGQYEQTLQRQQRLLAAEATSLSDYEAAKAKVEGTREQIAALEAEIAQRDTEVAAAQTNLAYTRITAPIDGAVLAVVSMQGQTVNAVQSAPTIVMLGNQDSMTVHAEISEADVIRTALGQEVFFTILGNPYRRYTSTLRDIAPAPESITNEDRSSLSAQALAGAPAKTAIYYSGLFDVENTDGQLRAYMTAQVSIVLGRAKSVLTIPSTALGARAGDGSYAVQVLGPDGRVQTRKIEIGLDDQLQVEVKRGLSEGEQVVLGDPETRTTSKAKNPSHKPNPNGPAA